MLDSIYIYFKQVYICGFKKTIIKKKNSPDNGCYSDLSVMNGAVYQWHPQVGGWWYQYTGTPEMRDTPEKRTDESLWSLHQSRSAMLGNAHTYQQPQNDNYF